MTVLSEHLAALIEAAPLRAITGLSASHESLRHWATHEIAEYLADNIDRPLPVCDPSQLALPL